MFSNSHSNSKWCIVWFLLPQGHVGVSSILNRYKYIFVPVPRNHGYEVLVYVYFHIKSFWMYAWVVHKIKCSCAGSITKWTLINFSDNCYIKYFVTFTVLELIIYNNKSSLHCTYGSYLITEKHLHFTFMRSTFVCVDTMCYRRS